MSLRQRVTMLERAARHQGRSVCQCRPAFVAAVRDGEAPATCPRCGGEPLATTTTGEDGKALTRLAGGKVYVGVDFAAV